MEMTLTDNAVKKIKDILAEEQGELKLRISVVGGGCSGMSYVFNLEENINDDDFVVENGGVTLLIDSMSFQYLVGASIDYTETLESSSFTIINPTAKSVCGCGSSFSV